MTLIHLLGPQSRARAKQAIDAAPDGFECEVHPRRKTREQEKLFHALLPELARSPAVIAKHGRHTTDEWKAELVKARFGVRIRPSFLCPGEFVIERVSTRKLNVRQYNDLIELTYATGAQAGHEWAAYRPDDYAEARVSERRAG